jgi:hypothetical protein
MKKTWLTLAAACIFLLCAACGQKAEESTLSAQPTNTAVPTTATAEPTAQPDALEDQLRASIIQELPDLDLTLTLGITQDDAASIRTATLQRRATGDTVAWAVTLPDSQVWFSRDTAYLTGSYGSYQGPISLEEFQTAVPSLPQLLCDLPDWTVQESDSGYTVAFSSQDTQLWQYFQPMISRMAPELALPDCTALDLSGTADLDQNGAIVSQSVKLTLDLDGQTAELLCELSGQPADALPELPEADYLELSDPTLPGIMLTAYGIAVSDPTQTFQNLVHLTVTQDEESTTYKQQDLISSSQGKKGLSCTWTTTYGQDDDVLRTVEDRYSQGAGTLTDDEDVTDYSYDDDTMWADIANFITAYQGALITATDITVSRSDGCTEVTLTLDGDAYAKSILSGYLQQLTDLDPEDAEDFQASGTLTLWLTDRGTLSGQVLFVEGTLTLEDEEPISLTLNDWGMVS